MFCDLRYAARHLWASPGLVTTAVLSLGLGIGVNTTLFSIFNAVFLHQVTASDPDHVFRIWPGEGNKLSYANYRDLLASKAVPDLAGSHGTELNLRIGEDVEKVSGEILTPNFFRVVGIAASTGRTFTAEDDVVVISDGCWRRRFGGSSDILGRVLNLNGHAYTVVGVLPKGYRSVEGFGLAPELYLPIGRLTEGDLNQRGLATLDLFCRLSKEMSRQQAAAAFTAAAKDLERIYPESNQGLGRPCHFYPISGLGGFGGTGAPVEMLAFAGVLFAVVALVLLIACANVASLLLAHGAGRRHEMAIRLALGATRVRVIRGLLAESLLLSLLSAGFALLLSLWLTGLFSVVRIPGSHLWIELQLDPDFRVLLYAIAAALMTTVLCGLAPAWQTTRPALTPGLKSEERNVVHRRFTLRNGLVVGQVAISLTLLIASSLFLRSLGRIATVDPGFNVDHLLTAKVRLDPGRYRNEQQTQFLKQAQERLASLPGVVSTSIASIVPLAGDRIGGAVEIEGQTVVGRGLPVNVNHVGPRYFETMAIPLLRGREFKPGDGDRVAVVNETFVRRYLPNRNPLGARLRPSLGRAPEPWLEVVGVARDIKFITLGEDPTPVLYKRGGYQLHVRTAGSPELLLKPVKQVIAEMDSAATVEAKTMRESMVFAFVPNRIAAVVLGSMGALGLLLAMIGLYGVMSYAVTRRTREIGIRMALGATGPLMLRMALREGLTLVGAGVALGLGIATVMTRPLSSFLASGVSATDPVAFGGAALLLTLVGLAAGYIPARRATRVEPTEALRYE